MRRLQRGPWLSEARVRHLPRLFVLFYVLIGGAWLTLGDGLTDLGGRPIGTDFVQMYAASTLVAEGRPAAAYDRVVHRAAEVAAIGQVTGYYYPFTYPPPLLFAVQPLAHLPYPVAFVAWNLVLLAAYLAAARALVAPFHPRWVWRAIAFPPVFLCLMQGQTGLLAAALLGGGLLALRPRPVLAGVLFGLLTVKPQLGLLLPFALAAGGHWRAIAAAAGTAAILAAASAAAFGWAVWPAFLDSVLQVHQVVFTGRPPGLEKLQSVHAMLALPGLGSTIAYAAQVAVAALVLVVVARAWARPLAFERQAAALAAGSVLVTPYLFDYDLAVAGVAIAFLLLEPGIGGLGVRSRSLLAFAWIWPLVARGIAGTTAIVAAPAIYGALLYFALAPPRGGSQSGSRISSTE